jgi:hypothetical protein
MPNVFISDVCVVEERAGSKGADEDCRLHTVPEEVENLEAICDIQ